MEGLGGESNRQRRGHSMARGLRSAVWVDFEWQEAFGGGGGGAK